MGDRKSQSKYIPINSASNLLTRGPSKAKPIDDDRRKSQVKKHAPQRRIRLMIPFTAQCIHCETWIPRATKFHARQELAPEHDYLSVKSLRFYLRCNACHSELTFYIDPKNDCYRPEHGLRLAVDPVKLAKERQEKLEAEQNQAKDEVDAIRALELRTLESQRRNQIRNELADLEQVNSVTTSLSLDKVIQWHKNQNIQNIKPSEQQIVLYEEPEEVSVIGKNTSSSRLKRLWSEIESGNEKLPQIKRTNVTKVQPPLQLKKNSNYIYCE